MSKRNEKGQFVPERFTECEECGGLFCTECGEHNEFCLCDSLDMNRRVCADIVRSNIGVTAMLLHNNMLSPPMIYGLCSEIGRLIETEQIERSFAEPISHAVIRSIRKETGKKIDK